MGKKLNCWVCNGATEVSTEEALGVICTSCTKNWTVPTTKTEVLAEHPPKEAVQVETTEERNERIWRAIRDASQV